MYTTNYEYIGEWDIWFLGILVALLLLILTRPLHKADSVDALGGWRNGCLILWFIKCATGDQPVSDRLRLKMISNIEANMSMHDKLAKFFVSSA